MILSCKSLSTRATCYCDNYVAAHSTHFSCSMIAHKTNICNFNIFAFLPCCRFSLVASSLTYLCIVAASWALFRTTLAVLSLHVGCVILHYRCGIAALFASLLHWNGIMAASLRHPAMLHVSAAYIFRCTETTL